jgi:hypothetical protein
MLPLAVPSGGARRLLPRDGRGRARDGRLLRSKSYFARAPAREVQGARPPSLLSFRDHLIGRARRAMTESARRSHDSGNGRAAPQIGALTRLPRSSLVCAHLQAGPPDYVQPGFRSPHLGERFDLAGPLASLRALGWRPVQSSPASSASPPPPSTRSDSAQRRSRSADDRSGNVDHHPPAAGRNAWEEAINKVILIEFWASWFVPYPLFLACRLFVPAADDLRYLSPGARAASPPSRHCRSSSGRTRPCSRSSRSTIPTSSRPTRERRQSRLPKRSRRASSSGDSCAASLPTLGRRRGGPQ